MEEQMEHHNPNNEKMTMADRFIAAMFLPKEYEKLLRLSGGSVIGFMVVLMLLVSFIQYAIPTLGAIAGLGGIRNIVENELPRFSFQNGEFDLDEKIEWQDNSTGVYLLVDTRQKEFTKEDVPANVVQAVMVSRSNVLLYNEVTGIGTMVQEEQFSDYEAFTMSNSILADMAPMFYVLLVCVYVFRYLMLFVKYLIVALCYGVVMYLLGKNMLPDITFGKIYKIALFAQVLGTLVLAVTYCIGSTMLILTGSVFNMLVTIILMNKAMFTMRSRQDVL